jgi:Mn2+/Fe2+ NRAMP family transporter
MMKRLYDTALFKTPKPEVTHALNQWETRIRLLGIDLIKALLATAVINGLVAPPLLILITLLGSDRKGGCPDRRGTPTAILAVDGQTVTDSAISWRSRFLGAARVACRSVAVMRLARSR